MKTLANQDPNKGTSQKPARKPGKNGNVLPDTPVPFTSERQPTPEAKKEGWAKKKLGLSLAKAILEQSIQGTEHKDKISKTAEMLGIGEDEVTIEMLLHTKQVEKAISDGDTAAYKEIMNRAYGMPKQTVENTGSQKFKVTVKKNEL